MPPIPMPPVPGPMLLIMPLIMLLFIWLRANNACGLPLYNAMMANATVSARPYFSR